MDSPPPEQQAARAILRALVQGLRLHAGQGTLIGPLEQQARIEGVDPRSLFGGLKHAVDQGWLLYDENSAWVGLTQTGVAVACHDDILLKLSRDHR